jgi:aminoglycoside phosphotransferase (APT) family kinase protein
VVWTGCWASTVVIDAALVRRLVADQFPQWGRLPVRPVDVDGWDNCTFKLGDDLSVRLPSSASYVDQVGKEQRWLPVLAAHLPLPIPSPVAIGVPADDYPFPWSVYRWLAGQSADAGRIEDPVEFAATLAGFLNALYRVDPSGGPEPGLHNFFRGGPLATYDDDTRQAIDRLGGQIPTDQVTEVWEAALAAPWDAAPVWFHGDVAAGNLLVSGGRLAAVIDFGSSGVGDPACDTSVAWTLLSGPSRQTFAANLAVDAGTWARGRGWTLWKALITMAGHLDGAADGVEPARSRRVLDEVLADFSGRR